MCICVCVCVCVCTCVCVCVCVCVKSVMWRGMQSFNVCLFVCVCLCVRLHIFLFISYINSKHYFSLIFLLLPPFLFRFDFVFFGFLCRFKQISNITPRLLVFGKLVL